MWLKTSGRIMRTQNPGVVWKPTIGVGTLVAIHELPSGGNSNLGVRRVECKLLGVGNEMKQMSMRPAKTLGAIHTKRVIPNDPTAATKSGLLGGNL